MRVIAKAIADRQSEIERLQVEIKALNEVDKIEDAWASMAGDRTRTGDCSRSPSTMAEFSGRNSRAPGERDRPG